MESYPASNLQSAVGFRKMLGDLILQSKLLWNAPSKTIQIDQLHSFESLRLLFPKEDSRFHPLNNQFSSQPALSNLNTFQQGKIT